MIKRSILERQNDNVIDFGHQELLERT
jgi:hypothetical protein